MERARVFELLEPLNSLDLKTSSAMNYIEEKAKEKRVNYNRFVHNVLVYPECADLDYGRIDHFDSFQIHWQIAKCGIVSWLSQTDIFNAALG
ncbi:hypothetical protein NPIL_487671 [Nephila pilipes]|uniref:Uncharacterized protein n=1 Tax=Nephila pilipes TaxID=299642 RepID=A0A8X6Q1M4_NEPPI|nr:hypothetical protein NPIL_487671 [Nephila pilipes]